MISYFNRNSFMWNAEFEKKFKRKPKIWTIEKIHDLWVKACHRSSVRNNIISEYTNRIIKEIPKNSKGEHIVYFRHKKYPEEIMQYSFSYHDGFKSYGMSTSNTNAKLMTREEKLDFFLTNEKAFEMGQEYYKIKKMYGRNPTHLQYIVQKIMWELIEDKLRKHFKGLNITPSDIFIIDISDKKYYVELDPPNIDMDI